MNTVFVLDTNRQILAPSSFKRAQMLLHAGKAAVFRRYPFTIILKHAVKDPMLPPHRLKIDPGSKTTGLAIVNEQAQTVIFACEITHRGQQIRDALLSRRAIRRNRRARKTRYRQPRFLNRTRPAGWLAPSLRSRVENIMTWVNRLRWVCPISALSQELVRFDMQKLENPEISGIEYQQGTLAGYEIKEYLLEKCGRACRYCKKQNVPLEVEHIIPRSRGGSDRVSNLTIACTPCNREKNDQTAAEFGFPHIQEQEKASLKDAAAVNSTRWALYQRLCETGLPVEVGTGGRTKYNRMRLGIEKTHWGDAACVGASTPDVLEVTGVSPLLITATGHGKRQMCRTDKYGFPVQHRTRQKKHFGFQTGDIVRCIRRRGKYVGTWVSRVVVRVSGIFDVITPLGKAGVNQKECTLLFAADGYLYAAQLRKSATYGRAGHCAFSRGGKRSLASPLLGGTPCRQPASVATTDREPSEGIITVPYVVKL